MTVSGAAVTGTPGDKSSSSSGAADGSDDAMMMMDEYVDSALDVAPDDEAAGMASMPASVCTDLVYNMLGFLLPWGVMPHLDNMVRSVLRLAPPVDVYSYVVPSATAGAVSVIFPSACAGMARWSVSPAMSAAHGLALLALLYPLSRCPMPSVTCMNTLRSLYVMYARELLTTLAASEAQVRVCARGWMSSPLPHPCHSQLAHMHTPRALTILQSPHHACPC